MKRFEEYLEKGFIKKRTKNTSRVKSLLEEAEKRYKFFKKMSITGESANYIIENMYDVVRELLEAKLLSEGYKAYHHEAILSYLNKLNFSSSQVKFLDELREIRHQTKYYGHVTNIDYAKKVSDFVGKIFDKLKDSVEMD